MLNLFDGRRVREFLEFSPKVPATMQPFGGKYLVRGGKVISLECAASKELMPVRSEAAKTRAYIVEGVTQ